MNIKIYDAEHSTCGLGEMFRFLMQTFKHPLPRPLKWDHIDVYPEFYGLGLYSKLRPDRPRFYDPGKC